MINKIIFRLCAILGILWIVTAWQCSLLSEPPPTMHLEIRSNAVGEPQTLQNTVSIHQLMDTIPDTLQRLSQGRIVPTHELQNYLSEQVKSNKELSDFIIQTRKEKVVVSVQTSITKIGKLEHDDIVKTVTQRTVKNTTTTDNQVITTSKTTSSDTILSHDYAYTVDGNILIKAQYQRTNQKPFDIIQRIPFEGALFTTNKLLDKKKEIHW